MSDEQLRERLQLKQEAKLAFELFQQTYKKVPAGIAKIYKDLVMSNETEKVKASYRRFFGYLKKSKNAKEKWKDDE